MFSGFGIDIGFHCVCVCVCVLSYSDSLQCYELYTPAPLSMRFSRQEYWSELPFPSAGDLPDPGVKLVSLASSALVGRFFTITPPGKPICDLVESLVLWGKQVDCLY